MINIEKNKNEIMRRFIKYIIHTILVFILLQHDQFKLTNQNIIIIALSMSCLFFLLDIFLPSISI